MKSLFSLLLVNLAQAAHPYSLWIDREDITLAQQHENLMRAMKPKQALVQQKYGDVTVHITQHDDPAQTVPERYSKDSDDHLMNMLISKGYAFSKEKSGNLKIKLDCGCNCNCCIKEPGVGLSSTDIDKVVN